MAASRPHGALPPVIGADLPAGMAISPVFHGTPDEVAEAVLAVPGLAAADGIVPAMGGSAHSSSRRRGRTPRGSVLTDRVL